MVMALTPFGILSSFLAITDGGMILFWIAALSTLVSYIGSTKRPNYVFIGFLICLGALFKWPIYILWIIIISSWCFFPFLISWRIVLGVAVSLVALLPSIYWNATHEWATFRHVSATITGGHGKPPAGALLSGNILEFIGAQAALISPILFVLLLIAFWILLTRKESISSPILFCGGMTALILLGGVTASIFMKIQGNWIVFAYPTACITIGWLGQKKHVVRNWLIGGLTLSIILCSAVFSIPSIQSNHIGSHFPIPYKINPFRHNIGWNNLSPALLEAGYNPDDDYLIGDKYQTVSILSFYSPKQKRAYFLNLQGARKNQFSFWPHFPEEQTNKRAFFVIVENTPHLFENQNEMINQYQKNLGIYFDQVRFIKIYPLFFAYEKMAKGALIFECIGYNGKQLPDTDLY